MRRDMDLVRHILAKLEEADAPLEAERLNDSRHTNREVAYHVYIMRQAGLIDARIESDMTDMWAYSQAIGLTWAGQDFLAAVRSDAVWSKVKRAVEERLGSATLDTIKAVTVKVLNMGTLENIPVGRMMVSVMFAMAEFERDMIVQRTQEGKEVARQRPGYREGRPPKVLPREVVRDYAARVERREMTVAEVCAELGVGRTRWYQLRKVA